MDAITDAQVKLWREQASQHVQQVREQFMHPESLEVLASYMAGDEDKCVLTPSHTRIHPATYAESAPLEYITKKTDIGPQAQMFRAAQKWTVQQGKDTDDKGTPVPAYIAREHDTGRGYSYAFSTWTKFYMVYGFAGASIPGLSIMPKGRQHYELIYHKLPCKLYFDVDASALHVPIVTGEDLLRFYKRTAGFLAIVEMLVNYIFLYARGINAQEALEDRPYRIKVMAFTANRKPGINKEESGKKPAKISIHYTVTILYRGAHVMFATSESVYSFTRLLYQWAVWLSDSAANRERLPALHSSLWLNLASGSTVQGNFITDLAVYSKNRIFRLWGSSKVGTARPLCRNPILRTLLCDMAHAPVAMISELSTHLRISPHVHAHTHTHMPPTHHAQTARWTTMRLRGLA